MDSLHVYIMYLVDHRNISIIDIEGHGRLRAFNPN
jgi:hypothetical protein